MEFENFVPSTCKLEYGDWFTKIETEIANAKCYSKNCFLCRFYSYQKLCQGKKNNNCAIKFQTQADIKMYYQMSYKCMQVTENQNIIFPAFLDLKANTQQAKAKHNISTAL